MTVLQRVWRTGVVFLACLAGFSGMSWGQGTNSADVTGTVTDSSGAVIPGVTVTARNLDKNTERTIVPVSTVAIFDGSMLDWPLPRAVKPHAAAPRTRIAMKTRMSLPRCFIDGPARPAARVAGIGC